MSRCLAVLLLSLNFYLNFLFYEKWCGGLTGSFRFRLGTELRLGSVGRGLGVS